MSKFQLPVPATKPRFREHEVADPQRPAVLSASIVEEPELLEELFGRHILSLRHFSRELMLQLFRLAAGFESGGAYRCPGCRDRILITAFLDQANNRTRLSFESAALSLGIRIMSFNENLPGAANLDVNLVELAEMFNSYGDLVLLRTRGQADFETLCGDLRIPVINVGDGANENPTQALIDLYTLFKWRPDLLEDAVPEDRRLNVGIFGEPWRTRTIRSLLLGLARFPQAVNRIVVFGRSAQIFSPGQREELQEAGLAVECTSELYPEKTMLDCLRRELPRQDVVYSHMLNPPELSRMDRLEGISLLKENAMVLHPRVRIRELSLDLDDGPHNAYFEQARGAVHMRSALLSSLLGHPGAEAAAE